jgi:hypothetical protein
MCVTTPLTVTVFDQSLCEGALYRAVMCARRQLLAPFSNFSSSACTGVISTSVEAFCAGYRWRDMLTSTPLSPAFQYPFYGLPEDQHSKLLERVYFALAASTQSEFARCSSVRVAQTVQVELAAEGRHLYY